MPADMAELCRISEMTSTIELLPTAFYSIVRFLSAGSAFQRIWRDGWRQFSWKAAIPLFSCGDQSVTVMIAAPIFDGRFALIRFAVLTLREP
jgi:hypothetical protein